jgi:ATP-dependent helicase HrpA
MLAELEKKIHASRELTALRRSRLTTIEYPDELPVSARREDIAAAIRDNQVVVVAGETGSGKTTQLPKICLELGRGASGLIGHTQPRRIAARSVAERIATELHTEPGQVVGFKVRFHDHMHASASVKLMTDGILLAEIQQDRDLLQYDTLIIDEAHERSLNIDFLLGYLKQLLPRRPELKIIITSATIDTARFAKHFDNAPVIEVTGRTWPVEVRYRPPADENDGSMLQSILDAVDEVSAIDRGDILVFLVGEREIRETAEALRKHHPPDTDILPLYARLSVSEQSRVFQAHKRRRIVLATNVAETSLTVPGIRFVIDTGLARISRYSVRSRVQRLPVEKVSQASANQRMGRCGRISEGICVRLYDEQDFDKRPHYTPPEILRTNLAAVILQMRALDLGDVEAFPFVDAPETRHINDGYRLLFELGALDQRQQLSPSGGQLARLPVDPRIGRMLLEAAGNGCVAEVLVIASALGVQDPRERPLDRQQQADAAHERFHDERSDFLGLLRLWTFYHEQKKKLSHNKLRKLCKQNFLAWRRMIEWHDIHQQLLKSMIDLKLYRGKAELDESRLQPAYLDTIHQSLLAGLLANVGFRDEDKEFLGGHGKRFRIFPGSGLASKPPKWVMAAELVETSRLYARTVAAIRPEWIEALAAHVVRHSYSEPHWQKRRAQVAAWEQVSLYGLVIVPRRRINYGPIDPPVSREIFIREALVEGEYDTRAPFFAHNRGLLQSVELLEHKSRRRDILVDEQDLYAFYDRIIPEDIYNGKAFEKWRKQAEGESPRLLFLERDSLLREDAPQVRGDEYPDTLDVSGYRLPLQYRFEPGHEADGVSLHVPLAMLNQIDEHQLDWLVPGLLPARIEQWLRSLPKRLRQRLVPIQQTVQTCLPLLDREQGALPVQLSRCLLREFGVEVAVSDWDRERLPGHLRMRICVEDDDGRVLRCSRSLESLQSEFADQASASFSCHGGHELERDDIGAWDFGELPGQVDVERNGHRVAAWPALSDEDGSVALRLFDTAEAAAEAMPPGLRRLFMRQRQRDISYLRKHLPGIKQLCLNYTAFGDCEELKDSLVDKIVAIAFGDGEGIRDHDAFERQVLQAATKLVNEANLLCDSLGQAFELRRKLMLRLEERSWPETAFEDISMQMEYLFYPGFLHEVPASSLLHYPRYLQALLRRLERLAEQPQRDEQLMAEITPFWHNYLEASQRNLDAGVYDEHLEDFHWLLEEYRVSLFAQELKTARPVSAKRLRQAWQGITG